VKLYGVKWVKDKPSVVETDAERHGEGWLLRPPEDDTWENGQAFGHRFGVRNMIPESARERYLIGTDPVDAVYLSLQHHKTEESVLEAQLIEVRSRITELAVLGMAAAGVKP